MDVVLAIFIPVPFAFILLSLLSLAYYKLCPTRTTLEDVEVGHQKKPSPRHFKSSEIDALSSNLASSPVIGVGGFSTVYLTSLQGIPSSTCVAVKVHNLSQHLHRAFRQELDILLRVDHPHIVHLLGYCDDKDKGILVFEYIPNGTLNDILHASNDPCLQVLPWSQRVSILFCIATALEYLHEGCGLPIIHGDIKSSNVLLNDILEPKLCDFGFARMGFKAAVTRSAHQIIGSLGYVDPHYLRTGLVLKKSDVYSFGVLILEMVTGMEAFDTKKEKLLTTVIGLAGVGELIDPKLGEEYDGDEASVMIELATWCIAEQPVLRPSMGDVIKMMKEKVCLVSHKGKLHM